MKIEHNHKFMVSEFHPGCEGCRLIDNAEDLLIAAEESLNQPLLRKLTPRHRQILFLGLFGSNSNFLDGANIKLLAIIEKIRKGVKYERNANRSTDKKV